MRFLAFVLAPLFPLAFPALPVRGQDAAATNAAPPEVSSAAPAYVPAPTLADEIKATTVSLQPDYASAHPRLLFSEADRAALQEKAKAQPALWHAVLNSARAVTNPASLPPPDLIASGAKYWRVESAESAALAWFVTGDAKYRDGAIPWLLAYARQPVWGAAGFHPNTDLPASWYLYHLSIAYDIFYPGISPADRTVIQQGLALHAQAISDRITEEAAHGGLSYDQNHTYIPTVSMVAAALALFGDVPAAADWLRQGVAVLHRSRYVLGSDGYYYEGTGYWSYALHWHVRAADLLGRATGEKMFDLPALRDNWNFALQLSLPGQPWAYDIGDAGYWTADNVRPDLTFTNLTMLWDIAAATGSAESQLAGNFYAARHPETDYPASAFLWFDPALVPAKLSDLKPYHYFPDHDVVAWRSDWTEDATCYLFRCGPPLGPAALAKLGQLKDWTMDTGHVHADIGSFWMYARGAYLAVGTGYTSQKWTRDQNTLLIDGQGQAMDGDYHNAHGVPYGDLDQAHIDGCYLSDAYGYATGEFGSAYRHQVKGVDVRRTLLMTKRWLLIVDDMKSDLPHQLTFLCHADAPFQAQGPGFVASLPQAALAVLPLSPTPLKPRMAPATVTSGRVPGEGLPARHGYYLGLTMAKPDTTAHLVYLLVPLGLGDTAPQVLPEPADGDQLAFSLKWADGKTEKVALSLHAPVGTTLPSSGPGPATITLQ